MNLVHSRPVKEIEVCAKPQGDIAIGHIERAGIFLCIAPLLLTETQSCVSLLFYLGKGSKKKKAK